MTAVEQIAAVLAEHSYTYPDSFCGCGAYVGAAPWRDHAEHVAAALLPLLDAAAREAAAKAWDEGAVKRGQYRGSVLDLNPYREERAHHG